MLGYIASWFINFLVVSIIVAAVDEYKGYYIERDPWVPFTLAFLVPTALELLAAVVEGRPFLATIWPGFVMIFGGGP